MKTYKIKAVGDKAITVEFSNEISEAVNQKVTQLNQKILKGSLSGIEATIPTYRALLIQYEPLEIGYELLKNKLEVLLDEYVDIRSSKSKVYVIPVCYGGDYGPDIERVASTNGLSCDEVITMHSERDYRIYMLGFTPGFPYLGGMNPALETPRLTQPRIKIQAGSVGIAGKQTGIYPIDSPGGWQIIGRTPLKLFDSERKPSILLESGAYIRFKAIDASTYERIAVEVAAGVYRCIVEEKIQEAR